MRIASLETFTDQHARLGVVRVRTDDGAEGYGEMAHSNTDISAMVLHRQIAPLVLGADPLDAEGLARRVIEQNYKFPGSYVCRALAGVDTALWDLRGKVEGKSVCALLGGRRTRVAVYGSSMRRDTTPQQEVGRILAARQWGGFRAFKLKIAKRLGHDEDEWPGRTESVVCAVRAALGEEVPLLVDANSGYGPAGAIEVGRMLQQQGVCHFEEPCPWWELEETAEVAAALELPVAGGEQDTDLAQFRRMIRMRAVDVVQPDICYVGGLSRALRVAEMARQAHLPVTPHSPGGSGSMIRVFTLHYLAAIPNAGPFMEYSIEPGGQRSELYAPVLRAADGELEVPQGAGWGVTVRAEWLAAAKRTVSPS
ncbi:MAG: mandelate racemase/muconate lactonizing enzyme family protein [Phycisphaerae bacterium]|nr:mandelate racemase/muconate lactonizing enzyme family protein [Phycisphaerae bacterium]